MNGSTKHPRKKKKECKYETKYVEHMRQIIECKHVYTKVIDFMVPEKIIITATLVEHRELTT
jgi:hypothetical protein